MPALWTILWLIKSYSNCYLSWVWDSLMNLFYWLNKKNFIAACQWFWFIVKSLSPFATRLFGSKSCNKQAPVTTMENMKNSTIISNPHATSIQQNGSLEMPSVASGGSGPVYSDNLTVPSGGHGEQTLSSVASTPGSAFSPWGGHGFLSQSSNQTNSDSIGVSLGKEDLCLNRTNSARTGLSER